jgi:hypothetical protein
MNCDEDATIMAARHHRCDPFEPWLEKRPAATVLESDL